MKRSCLLIPGNPAVAGYYLEWIEEIERASNLEVTYATSYMLFGRRLNSREYDLAMMKHYEDIFLNLCKGEKIVIIAHSVGSYFALRLLTKYPEKIEKVFIMFPYIGYSKIFSLRFVSIPYLIDRVFPLTEIVSAFKNIFHRWDKSVLDISNKELASNLRFGVRQCHYFNSHKLETNSASFTKDKIDLIYCDNDRWCPEEAINILKPVTNHKKTDLPHDFILSKPNRLKMINELGLSNL